MAFSLPSLSKLFRRRGRPTQVPQRDTRPYPSVFQVSAGQRIGPNKSLPKSTPRNLRYFAKTPIARRAVNTIKNPIAMLDWEIAPKAGVELNAEIAGQIEVVKACFERPNNDDSFRTLIEQLIEDILCGAGAVEIQPSGNVLRPLWMWPVDGLTIQVYPGWSGKPNEIRYAQVLGFGTYTGGDQRIDLRNDELIYVRPNPNSSTPFGVGALEVAFNTVANLLATGEFVGNVASNQRPAILIDLGDIDSDAIGAFRSFWRNEVEGQGQVPIVGMGGAPGDHRSRGIEIQRLHPEGDQGMFLKYQEFLMRVIAAAFDISPANLSIERDVNRSTADTAQDRDYNHAIRPLADLISSHLTREAIHGVLGFSQIEFRWKNLNREDEEATSQIWTRYWQNNIVTANEVRTKIGLPRLTTQWSDLLRQDLDISKLMVPAGNSLDEILELQKSEWRKLFPPAEPVTPSAQISGPQPDLADEYTPQKRGRKSGGESDDSGGDDDGS